MQLYLVIVCVALAVIGAVWYIYRATHTSASPCNGCPFAVKDGKNTKCCNSDTSHGCKK